MAGGENTPDWALRLRVLPITPISGPPETGRLLACCSCHETYHFAGVRGRFDRWEGGGGPLKME